MWRFCWTRQKKASCWIELDNEKRGICLGQQRKIQRALHTRQSANIQTNLSNNLWKKRCYLSQSDHKIARIIVSTTNTINMVAAYVKLFKSICSTSLRREKLQIIMWKCFTRSSHWRRDGPPQYLKDVNWHKVWFHLAGLFKCFLYCFNFYVSSQSFTISTITRNWTPRSYLMVPMLHFVEIIADNENSIHCWVVIDKILKLSIVPECRLLCVICWRPRAWSMSGRMLSCIHLLARLPGHKYTSVV